MFFSEAVERMRFSGATGYFGKDHGDVVNFSLGEPKDEPPRSAVDAYMECTKDENASVNRYAPVQGIPELRESLAEKLKHLNDIDARPEDILITSGASEGLAFSIMSLIGRGDEAIIVEPSYPIISPMVSFCGGRPLGLHLGMENGFTPDLEMLKETISSRTKMVIINTPHNPTGTVLDRRSLKAISEIFDGAILVDEVYENFTYGIGHSSMASIADVPENVITVNSFSKTYSMCGYRVGYLHANEGVIKRMLKLKLCVSTCTSNPSQRAAIAALGDKHFPIAMKRRFDLRRGLLVDGLKMLGLPLVEPKGAFYVFPDITEFGSDQEAFEFFLKAGVLTMPGSIFHEKYDAHLRFSFAADRKEIADGIARLEGIIA